MKINGQLMIIRVEISKEAFVDRNADAVPLQCQFEREICAPTRKNLRAHGEPNCQSKCDTRELIVNYKLSIIN